MSIFESCFLQNKRIRQNLRRKTNKKNTKEDSKKLTKLLTMKLFFLEKMLNQKDKKFQKVENNFPINLNLYFWKMRCFVK